MSPEPVRRKKPPAHYRILIVPGAEGGETRSASLSRLAIWSLGLGTVVLIAGATLALVMYTPVGQYIPIAHPELERRYGAQLQETQDRLQGLAEDVMLLRDYNIQLRKALGDRGTPDTVSARFAPSLIASAERAPSSADSVTAGSREGPAGQPADMDLNASYTSVITGAEGFRAAFPLVHPAGGMVTQEFDPASGHFGIDYAARPGAPVFAAADGTVQFAGWTYDSGNMILLAHGGGYVTVYRHAQSLLAGEREFVRRGQPIATVGNTGRTSRGPHLHFEFWKDGVALDPREYLLNAPAVQ